MAGWFVCFKGIQLSFPLLPSTCLPSTLQRDVVFTLVENESILFGHGVFSLPQSLFICLTILSFLGVCSTFLSLFVIVIYLFLFGLHGQN